MAAANRHSTRICAGGVCARSALALLSLIPGSAGFGQVFGDGTVRPTPEVYAEHLERVMQRLPPNSGPPPLLDLSRPGENVPGAGKKWEDRFTGSMGARPIEDPGIHSLDEATSIRITTTDYAGSPPVLPAKGCPIVAIVRPLKASAHLAYNRRFVYSSFEVELVQVLKGRNKSKIREGQRTIVAQLGGSVRFPSGHETACLDAHEGFLERGKQYLLFLWKPVKDSLTYMSDEEYLLEGGHVYPLETRFGEMRYNGVSVEEFLNKVKSAIRENVDTN